MQRVLLFALLAFVIAGVGCRQTQTPSAGRPAGSAAGGNRFEVTSSDAYFAKFQLKPAPSPAGLLLKRGDQLAICGDSITEQKIKEIFHGPEGQANIEAAAARTEADRLPLAAAIKAAFQPVTHTLKIEPN